MITGYLLTSNKASLVLPTSKRLAATPTIVTIDTNGRIYRCRYESRHNALVHEFRGQLEVEYTVEDTYTDWAACVEALAEKQEFSTRQSGVEETTKQHATASPDVIELQPKSKGAVLLSSPSHLPVGVYLATTETYRITADGSFAYLEYRPDNHSEWTEIDTTNPAECGQLLSTIADRTDLQWFKNTRADTIQQALATCSDSETPLQDGTDHQGSENYASVRDAPTPTSLLSDR